MERISKSVDWIAKAFKDGGRNGWLAVMGLFSTWMVWIGLIKGLAVMLPTLQEQFNASTWLVGWMIAIIDASIECSGKLHARDRSNCQALFQITYVETCSSTYMYMNVETCAIVILMLKSSLRDMCFLKTVFICLFTVVLVPVLLANMLNYFVGCASLQCFLLKT